MAVLGFVSCLFPCLSARFARAPSPSPAASHPPERSSSPSRLEPTSGRFPTPSGRHEDHFSQEASPRTSCEQAVRSEMGSPVPPAPLSLAHSHQHSLRSSLERAIGHLPGFSPSPADVGPAGPSPIAIEGSSSASRERPARADKRDRTGRRRDGSRWREKRFDRPGRPLLVKETSYLAGPHSTNVSPERERDHS